MTNRTLDLSDRLDCCRQLTSSLAWWLARAFLYRQQPHWDSLAAFGSVWLFGFRAVLYHFWEPSASLNWGLLVRPWFIYLYKHIHRIFIISMIRLFLCSSPFWRRVCIFAGNIWEVASFLGSTACIHLIMDICDGVASSRGSCYHHDILWIRNTTI